MSANARFTGVSRRESATRKAKVQAGAAYQQLAPTALISGMPIPNALLTSDVYTTTLPLQSAMDPALVQELVRLKLRDNRLPRGHAVAFREIGRFASNGRPCDACGEGIGAHRKAVLVMVSAQWLSVFFHAECYEVWDAERLLLSHEDGDGAAT